MSNDDYRYLTDEDVARAERDSRRERMYRDEFDQKMQEIDERLGRLNDNVNNLGTVLMFAWIALGYLLAKAWGWM